MHEYDDSGIFVFGFKILDVKRDALSSLPLELSWKIFSYLDDGSLQTSCKVHKLWKNIILSCKKLRRRLNHFGLAMRLGSERLAKFHRRNRRRLRKERKRKNYLEVQEDRINIPPPIKTLTWKRKADDLVIHIKRYKLY